MEDLTLDRRVFASRFINTQKLEEISMLSLSDNKN